MRLDRLKEEVAYFKFWQGIVVVTDISLLGWLISLLTFGAVLLHRRIDRRIGEIGEL